MTSIAEPSVTAVIPTFNRPNLALRAIHSVLNQTFAGLELVVVIDGPDESTLAALGNVSDPRLRVLPLPEKVGGSMARNLGVRAARGKWIAFLDDDDEWLPEKLAKQLAVAESSKLEFPIVSSQLIARMASGDEIWPRKAPKPPLCEYLLARDSWSYGEGVISTITILAPKALFEHCEFKPGLKRCQDWDWMLRCARQPGTGVEFVAEPLAIWHVAENRASVTNSNDWEFGLNWVREMKDYMTPRAYAGYIASALVPQASAQKAWHVFMSLLREMQRNGAPKPFDYALFLGMWLPKGFRRALARL